MPLFPTFKFFGLGFAGFKGDEDIHYAWEPILIDHVWWGATYCIDDKDKLHLLRKGMKKFFDFWLMYLDENAKKTKNDKSKSGREVDGEIDALFGRVLEEFKMGNKVEIVQTLKVNGENA